MSDARGQAGDDAVAGLDGRCGHLPGLGEGRGLGVAGADDGQPGLGPAGRQGAAGEDHRRVVADVQELVGIVRADARDHPHALTLPAGGPGAGGVQLPVDAVGARPAQGRHGRVGLVEGGPEPGGRQARRAVGQSEDGQLLIVHRRILLFHPDSGVSLLATLAAQPARQRE